MTTAPRPLRRPAAVAAVLAAAFAAAGCFGGEDDPGAPADAERPANPPTTLTEHPGERRVTLARSARTHDGDVVIDRATGRIYAAWAQDRPRPKGADATAGDAFVAYSDDGGKTFSEPVRTNPRKVQVTPGFNSVIRIVSTGADRVLVLYPSRTRGVQTQLSTDGGRTWSAPEPIARPAGGYGTVATYGRNAYVGYLDYRVPVTAISVVRSADGGKTFGKSRIAETSSCGCCDNAMAVDNDGTLFFSYRNMDQRTKKTQIRDTTVVRSYDHGKTWSDPVALGKDEWEFNGCPEAGPELAVDGRNTLHAVYWTGKPGRPGVYYTWSRDDGASFAKPLAVAVESFYPPPYMDIAVQKDGTGWIVWDDRRTKRPEVHLARVRDGELETVRGKLDDGVTPVVDSDGSMVAMAWSNDRGFHVSVAGKPARDGYGSGPGGEDSGQEDEHAGHH